MMDCLRYLPLIDSNQMIFHRKKIDLDIKTTPIFILGKRILSIDDCEVDHILPYSKGGKTDLSNAQLVLRYFNRAKSNNESYS